MDQTQNVIDAKTRRRLRQIAHHLHPIVAIGDDGITEGVIGETTRALADHELIKIKVHAAQRDTRSEQIGALATACQAQEVQRIGKVAVLYKKNLKPNEKLSNLKRFS